MRNLLALMMALVTASGLSAKPVSFGEWHLAQHGVACEIWTPSQLGMASRMSISTGISGQEVIGFYGPNWQIGGPPFFDLTVGKTIGRISAPGLATHEDVLLTQVGREIWLDPTREHETQVKLRGLVARATLAGETLVAETAFGAFGIYAVEGLKDAEVAYWDCIESLEVVS